MSDYEKPVHYSAALGAQICKRIRGTNKSLLEIAKEKGMPSAQTIMRWANIKNKRYEAFQEQYTDAYKIRVNNWVEERDHLSSITVKPLSPAQISDEYSCWLEDPKTGAKKYDDKLVARYMAIDQRARENQNKQRIDVLTKNIGQISFIYDRRYIEKKEIETTGKVETGIVMLDYATLRKVREEESKTIEGELDKGKDQ